MAIDRYLAMTGAEMASASPLPEKAAWMACHFSPYSTGLCNLPRALPKGSLLTLNDCTPIHGHDPERVCQELNETVSRLGCIGLVVDFQKSPTPESRALTGFLSSHLSCPVAVPPEYDTGNTAVFVPAVPTLVPVRQYLSYWNGQEIWLEAALCGQAVTLTANGTHTENNLLPQNGIVHADSALHCHYTIEEQPNALVFRTWRTRADLENMLEDAEGIRLAIGLYQELVTLPKASGFRRAGG